MVRQELIVLTAAALAANDRPNVLLIPPAKPPCCGDDSQSKLPLIIMPVLVAFKVQFVVLPYFGVLYDLYAFLWAVFALVAHLIQACFADSA